MIEVVSKMFKEKMQVLMLGCAICAMLTVLAVGQSHAEARKGGSDFRATAGTVTVNIAAVTGKSYVLSGIIGMSDSGVAAVNVLKANAAGVTVNYTTVFSYPVSATNGLTLAPPFPIWYGVKGYAYRYTLVGTANAGLIVNGYYE